ncbi:hypothetical protein D3C79_1050700 [compost metagenome]
MFHTFVAMATCFEANGIDSAVHFRLTQQSSNLLMERDVGGKICDFKTLSFGMSKTSRVEIAHDYDGSTEQSSGRSSG